MVRCFVLFDGCCCLSLAVSCCVLLVDGCRCVVFVFSLRFVVYCVLFVCWSVSRRCCSFLFVVCSALLAWLFLRCPLFVVC